MISLVVPAYNEEKGIALFVEQVSQRITLKEPFEMLVVNDGSTDATLKILEELKEKHKHLRVVSHEHNKGLGMALYTGFQNAKGRIIVTTDADMTHPPETIAKMAEKIDSGYDLCIGSRYVPGGGMENVPYWRILLSRVANFFFALLFFCRISDLTSGFRAYRSDAIRKIRIAESGFAVQLEITVKMLKQKARITEVPFVLINRKIGASKFNFIRMSPVYFFTALKLFFYRWFG